MREGWNVILKYDESWANVNIWFILKRGEEEVVVHPIDLTMTSSLVPWEVAPEPTIRIDRPMARQFLEGLADGLADAGYRPSELKAKDSELETLRAHLEDMRTLVFQALLPPEVPPKYIKER